MSIDLDSITKYNTWEEIPSHLKTKTALGREGKKPGSEPVGRIFQYRSTRWIMLYDEREAIPKRKISDEQRAQLAKNREIARKRRTCTECGMYYKEPIENTERICKECMKQIEEMVYWDQMHEKAKDTFHEWYTNRSWIILDTETTGLHDSDEIIEIAVINPAGETVFESLVRPMQPIPPDATAIHGISNNDVKNAPTWPDIIYQLNNVLEGKFVLIYNDEFDIRMIAQTCDIWDCAMPDFHSECVMKAFAMYETSDSYISLANATGVYNQTHRAADDCRLVLRLIDEVGGKINGYS